MTDFCTLQSLSQRGLDKNFRFLFDQNMRDLAHDEKRDAAHYYHLYRLEDLDRDHNLSDAVRSVHEWCFDVDGVGGSWAISGGSIRPSR